ncbi:hypothetical protein K457DRAFT_705455 [Linnemannia elongata AG-77]|uniref:Uncharacterized protein n=1 Tax=Linnemannia elongata AG-77 TaxID=1314771 RepID=A0A197JPI5_9FUNG|nr:hypothetical protein K457DRAFT_705455 [Linnemannia elongata AG-77]
MFSFCLHVSVHYVFVTDAFCYSSNRPLLHIHYPRGSLPKSVPEQMQPSTPMTPVMSRLNSGYGGSNSIPSVSVGNGHPEKPSSIRSNRSNASMASMRSVRSFIGTMFSNLKGGHGGHGGVGSGSSGNGGGSYPAGYSNHHSHGSTSSIGGYNGSRPGSGSSVGLTSSFTGMMPPTTPKSSNMSGNGGSGFDGDDSLAPLRCESPVSSTTNMSSVTIGGAAATATATPATSVSITPLTNTSPVTSKKVPAPGTPGVGAAVVSGSGPGSAVNGNTIATNPPPVAEPTAAPASAPAPAIVVNTTHVPFSESMKGFP